MFEFVNKYNSIQPTILSQTITTMTVEVVNWLQSNSVTNFSNSFLKDNYGELSNINNQ